MEVIIKQVGANVSTLVCQLSDSNGLSLLDVDLGYTLVIIKASARDTSVGWVRGRRGAYQSMYETQTKKKGEGRENETNLRPRATQS